jgi:hypothetical protein
MHVIMQVSYRRSGWTNARNWSLCTSVSLAAAVFAVSPVAALQVGVTDGIGPQALGPPPASVRRTLTQTLPSTTKSSYTLRV